ncbi:MAG: S41 family peptidase [Planctomycetota bacterium]|jgi:carboxyl-terminal processing protease
MENMEYGKRKYSSVLCWLAAVAICSIGYGLASRPVPVEGGKAGPEEVNVVEVEADWPGQSDVVTQTCELIYQGKFDAAGELIEGVPSKYDMRLDELLRAVREYQAMSQRRQAAQEAAYRKQLDALEELRTAGDSNDVKGITKALSVVATVNKFANEQQRQELLSDEFVKRTFEKAVAKAAEFDSEGKWFEAYVTCYSWLQNIVPENKQYSDRAEQLAEKANIVSSFEDSPCETFRERYERVEKEMFLKAIEALNFNYVRVIEYRQMAAKALRRCELLTEVVTSMEKRSESVSPQDSNDGSGPEPPNEWPMKGVWEPAGLSGWSAALSALSDDVEQTLGFTKGRFIEVFEKVLALNAATVEFPSTVLIAQYADAAFSALDPYTVMVWPRQVKEFEKEMTREFTGIGIEITKQKGLLTVASLLPDTPAYRSGLDAGDVIDAVDGIETKDMSLVCAVRMITGPAGTDVKLTVKRQSEFEKKEICITRAKITVPTIRGWQRSEAGRWRYMVDEQDKIGYVRVTSFTSGTASNLNKTLEELEAGGLRGLILDLRFNSGGLLDSAIEVTDEFVPEGKIVHTKPKWGMPTYAVAHREGTHLGYPMVVLINGYSASASEIVAGALQDKVHSRAILVGQRTLGKGSVQGITPYPGGGAQLKYTMAYYHLPSGQRVETQEEMKKQDRTDWGVGPNVELRLRSDELRNLLSVQRDNDVLVRADHENDSTPLKRHTLEETLEADPQLAVGILVAKSQLVEEESKAANLEAAAL